MNSNFSSSFSRRGPDNITEELVAVLSGPKSYEFKALFLVIQAALRARNATSGGEEMLRLRAYDKLQNLVQHGQVKKTGKQYKGVRKGLLLLAEFPAGKRSIPLAPGCPRPSASRLCARERGRETTWDYIKAIENRRSSLKLSKGIEALVNRAVGAEASLIAP